MAGTNYGDDGGIGFLQNQLTTIQQGLTDINNQLQNINTGTFEGQQQSEALSDRKKMYEQALQQYTKLIADLQTSGDEAKRASGMKEQATRGYLTGMGTKKGATTAEIAKDVADISGAGAAERAGIQSKIDENLASARGGLSNLYMNIAQNEGQLSAAGGSSGGSGGGLSAYQQYLNQLGGGSGEVDPEREEDDETMTPAGDTKKSKDPNKINIGDIILATSHPIIGGINILKKIRNRKLSKAPIYPSSPQIKEFGMASMANNVFGVPNPVNQGTNNIFKKLTY